MAEKKMGQYGGNSEAPILSVRTKAATDGYNQMVGDEFCSFDRKKVSTLKLGQMAGMIDTERGGLS